MIEYATEYVAIASLDYRSVWWRLFHAPNSTEWSSVLKLVELLFSLPVSNGKLERVFSRASAIKVEKRSRLSNRSLDDLLLLNTPAVPLSSFNPDPSINLWWSDKTRRPSQSLKQHTSGTRHEFELTSVPESADGTDELLLDDWDSLLA